MLDFKSHDNNRQSFNNLPKKKPLRILVFIPADMLTNPNSFPEVIFPPKNREILEYPLIFGKALKKFNKTANRSLEQLIEEDIPANLLKDLEE